MRFPRECPAFEVVWTNYTSEVHAGDIVEGFIDPLYGDLRIVAAHGERTDWGAHYVGGDINARLRPLTPAAKAMIELVKRCA